MASVVSGTSIDHVCSTIHSIETNPSHNTPGPAINNLPAERAGREGHFESGRMKKGAESGTGVGGK